MENNILLMIILTLTVSLIKSTNLVESESNDAYLKGSEQIPSIYMNQSNNIHIVAKYGTTVNLPCIIYKLKNQDLSQVHSVWHKLVDKKRPIVLSIGNQQLNQDMRYRVKQVTLNQAKTNEEFEPADQQQDQIFASSDSNEKDYLIENWQFEIRKVTFEDAGTYQCLLSLVKPLTRNITLKILPEIIIEPKEANFAPNQKISINCKATIKFHHHHKNQRHPKPQLNWYKENELVKNVFNPNDNHKIEITSIQNQDNHSLNSMLIIYNAKQEDSGKYTCSYENYKEQTTVLVINDDEKSNFLMSSLNKANRNYDHHQAVCISIAFFLTFIFNNNIYALIN